jgi:coxsackievirus/adenovirus receptor
MSLFQSAALALVVASGALALTTDPCDEACPKTLIWVCGSDNISYTNLCALEVAQCRNKSISLAHEGMCVKDRTFEGNNGCPKCKEGGGPICGNDGLTYMNECALTAIACSQADNVLKMKHPGECTSDEAV